jgi:hypothetical protein
MHVPIPTDRIERPIKTSEHLIEGKPLSEVIIGYKRYEKLKNLTNIQFLELFVEHLKSNNSFNSIVDNLPEERKKDESCN